MRAEAIDGVLFADMIRAGAANLDANRKIVNDLNVFPIPDGDTGDNMYMTIESGAEELAGRENASLGDVASSASKWMLLGARGNSGVILSRIFAGISRGLSGVDEADPAVLSRAFAMGVDEAYGAVSVPVEGTILTVYKDAVRYAAERLGPDSTIRSYFDDFTAELRRSLERTPELLAVLKESGVVDSGGAGLLYIADGMRMALDGQAVRTADRPEETGKKRVDLSLFTEDSELTFGYCTEFLLRLQRAKGDPDAFDLEALIRWLNSVGDSVVAFREGTVVKVHVHTRVPGDVMNHCQQFGEFLTLKIENMTLQHSESTVQNRLELRPAAPRKPYGIVAVAAGEGIRETFRSLGCDEVVDGGQSMNPSAEDFVRAFARINADTILVFPNNGNVILTARQAAGLYDKADVRIVPSRTVGEGYAAVSQLDTSSGDTDAILAELDEVVAGVVTGFVSRASRDADRDGVSVRAGDFIGFAEDTIYTDASERNAAALALAGALDAGKYDVMLVVRGAGASAEEAEALCGALGAAFRRTEVIPVDGGQPIHDYILILE